jgi:hypothetical protein
MANQAIERDLTALRDDLLRSRPRTLRPDEGDEAFQQHKLLATAVHRVTKLDQQKSESETDAWVRFVTRHFPAGRNAAAYARLLFGDWRTSLLKKDAPGPGVALTHGQSSIHWQCDRQGRLCLNLEDAWDDYAASVESFVAYLRTSPRRKFVLARWRKQHWVVEPFIPAIEALAGATVMNTSLPGSTYVSVSTVSFVARRAGLPVGCWVVSFAVAAIPLKRLRSRIRQT